MDVNDFWQENKRFVLSVAGGLVAFTVGVVLINHFFGEDLAAETGKLNRAKTGLSAALFQPPDLELARSENQSLAQAVTRLGEAIEFKARPAFQLGESSATNRYFAVVSSTREDLLARAGRAGVAIPDDLGLPVPSPTKEQEIVRYLEALDLIERATQLTIEAGVERLEEIRIALDPRLLSGKSLEGIEKTLVKLKLKGTSLPLSRMLLLAEQPREGQTLLVERAELTAATGAKADEARLELWLVAAHQHGEAAPAGSTTGAGSSARKLTGAKIKPKKD
jgi:hypothetical protein